MNLIYIYIYIYKSVMYRCVREGEDRPKRPDGDGEDAQLGGEMGGGSAPHRDRGGGGDGPHTGEPYYRLKTHCFACFMVFKHMQACKQKKYLRNNIPTKIEFDVWFGFELNYVFMHVYALRKN
ncbi:hypothetical protein HanIR_Chr02g0090141 [Helianthus annuus]|nr:hypothetical protein HanIR_Chr02g0090141 [Helianthus annuus]